MKKVLLAFLLFSAAFYISAQNSTSFDSVSLGEQFQEGPRLTIADSVYSNSLPQLTLPKGKIPLNLPPVADNSKLPFLRPVFSQVGASCGQASAVGYNFTYEMAHARGVAANTPENQYPTHFVYNFDNTCWEYFGVSYFNSLEILKKCGTMNVKDYKGFTDNGNRWITGYDLYYNGMKNRIEDVYSIKTNTEEGIRTLKSWVYDHLGESIYGGVASFYATPPWNAVHFAADTPEAGRYVVTKFSGPATHAMTIVGYNDSVRYDYNQDGKYTNDIDLNNDGILDVRDWEIGAFRFVNSYGVSGSSATDGGFCYMMYRTLAEDYNHGGIWNNVVHILKVKSAYTPLLTMKVRLNHSQRNTLRVRAGVSQNTTALFPEHVMDFPIFNFQGGSFPMQGTGSSDTLNTIEFGLDITPLLGFISANRDAVYFLSVEENDPFSQATGKIESCAVINYSTGHQVITFCSQTPVEILNNDKTYAKIISTSGTEKVSINETSLPVFVPNQPYEVQLTASGGSSPYKWSLGYQYTQLKSNHSIPAFDGIKLIPMLPSDSVIPVPLGFSFPFYGKKYDTVYVNINNGYLQFTTDKIPWPYLSEENFFLQCYKLIVPVSNQNISPRQSSDGAWYRIENSSAQFRWKLRKKAGESYIPYEFQVKLTPDGSITFNRGKIDISEYELFHSGISNGDKENSDLTIYHTEYDANLYNQIEYVPGYIPDDLAISQDGKLECSHANINQVGTIICKVKDYRNIACQKSFLFTAGIIAELIIKSGGDSIISGGEDVFADLVINNLTSYELTNLKAVLNIKNEYITMSDSVVQIAGLAPNSKVLIPDAFHFTTSPLVPDQTAFIADLAVTNNEIELNARIPENINSHTLVSIELQKLGKGFQQPGETGEFQYRFGNIGHMAASDVVIQIGILNPALKLITPAVWNMGTIEAGSKSAFEFQVMITQNIPLGTIIPTVFTLFSDSQLFLVDTLYFRLGKTPVLVVDLDVNHESAPSMEQAIKNLGYLVGYATSITSEIDEYQSLFITLGRNTSAHTFNYYEGSVLTDYLDHGGNIYIESRTFWRGDLITALQPRFNIEPVMKTHIYDTLTGVKSGFLAGLSFLNKVTPVSQFSLKPLGSAFTLFHDTGYPSCVASAENNYKTIGSIFEFSSVQGITPESTKENLMQKYLNFFDVKQLMTDLKNPDPINGLKRLHIYPNPASDLTKFEFVLDKPTRALIKVFDVKGCIVMQQKIQNHAAGKQAIEWNLRNRTGQKVLPGLYFCIVETISDVIFGKFLVQ